MKNIELLSCWELKLKLENLEGYDFYIDIVPGNDKKGYSESCVIFSGRKNKKLDFVYGDYSGGEYFLADLEDILDDVQQYEVSEKEILKHYFKLKEISKM